MAVMRRFGPPPDPTRSYVNRIGAYGIIRLGDRLLLTEQDAEEREIQLPGGGVDPGEGAVAALARECLEETGWTIRVIRRLGAYQRFTYMPEYRIWARKVCHVYLCRPGPRHGAPRDPQHRAVWLPIGAAVAALSIDGERHFVRRFLGD